MVYEMFVLVVRVCLRTKLHNFWSLSPSTTRTHPHTHTHTQTAVANSSCVSQRPSCLDNSGTKLNNNNICQLECQGRQHDSGALLLPNCGQLCRSCAS